jgi:hypothetical protein
MLSSSGEVKIHNILTDYDIPFEEEYEFDDLISSSGRHLRFDFAIFDDEGNLECLLEFQGRQHYQSVKKFGGKTGVSRQKYNDNLKRQYCIKHNYKLVSIPYFDEDKISYDYLMQMIY